MFWTEVLVNSWPELQERFSGTTSPYMQMQNWAFRGMTLRDWELQTSLERLQVSGVAAQAERYLLAAFKRRAHHYLTDVPSPDNSLEWMALMQHYGAPTRLLDWTRSPYVALFFAFERAPDSEYCAIWAINLQWCRDRARQMVEQRICRNLNPQESLGDAVVFNQVFLEATVEFVAPLQPFRMNERLTIQQGLFLCPGNPSASFIENFKALDPAYLHNALHKLVVPGSLRIQVMESLAKMNISRATLFPGLDGFAQSLGVNIQVATSRGSISTEMNNIARYEEWGF